MADLTPKELDLLARLDDKPELQPHFFKKAKGLKWFGPLADRGYFKAKHNPDRKSSVEEGYVSIPYWPATDYLVGIAPELSANTQQSIAQAVLMILWSVTQDAIDRGIYNYRTWWQFAKVLRHIPTDLIETADLDRHVSYWLTDRFDRGLAADELGTEWLPELLKRDSAKARSIALCLLRLLYTAEVRERDFAGSKRKEAVLTTDTWHLGKITDATARESGIQLGIEACQLFGSNLERILKEMDNDGYSCIWRPAIEDHEQNGSRDDALDILIRALRDSLSGFISAAPDKASAYVYKLLQSPVETFKRIAIHAIAENFPVLGKIADEVLVKEHFRPNLRHEMWHLLNKRYADMSPVQQQAALERILFLEQTSADDQIDSGHSAYTQATWLAAVRHHSSELEQHYQRAIGLAKAEPEHPDFSSYHTSGWVTHESPLSRDELLTFTIDRLVGYLADYRDPRDLRGPGIDGLVGAFKTVIKDEPLRYSPHLDQFIDLAPCYIHAVLDAFAEIWKNKKSLPWDEIWAALLNFIKAIIVQERFWSLDNSEQHGHFVGNRHWVVSSIGRLIESGVQSDDHAFSPDLLPQSLDILRDLLSKQDGAEYKDDSDAVSVAINSPRGRCLEALINHALRSCRLADKDASDHTVVWADLEPLFTSELNRPGNYEFATLVAMYLPNFLYLSKEWTLSRLESIFNTDDQMRWRCAMQGYAHVNNVHQDVYEYLRDHGHLVRVLDDDLLRDKVSNKIIQHIAITYLHGSENINDQASLISTLLNRREPDEISQIIWFLWTLRDKGDIELASKVMELWPRIWAVIDTETQEGKKLASRLCTWIAFLPSIDDDNRTLATQSISFADIDHNGYRMLEELARISEQQPSEAALLWQAMLKGSSPDYPDRAIKTILKQLISLGEDGIRTAREITGIYIGRGTERPYLWLNEINEGAANV